MLAGSFFNVLRFQIKAFFPSCLISLHISKDMANLRLKKEFFESKRRSCWLINAKMTGLLLKSAGGKLIPTGNIFHVKGDEFVFQGSPNYSPPHSPQPRSPCGWCLHSSYTSLCLFIFQDILQEHACYRLKSMCKIWKVLIPGTNTDIDKHIAHVIKYSLFLLIKMSLVKTAFQQSSRLQTFWLSEELPMFLLYLFFPWGFHFFYVSQSVSSNNHELLYFIALLCH